MTAEIVSLAKYQGKDPAHILRMLADEIERGEHSDDPEVVVVLLGKEFHIYGASKNGLTGGDVNLMLDAAKLRLIKCVEGYVG